MEKVSFFDRIEANKRNSAILMAVMFAIFLAIVGLFDLGNFSDAFLVLRAQERGLGVDGVLWTLLGFNLVYALVASD